MESKIKNNIPEHIKCPMFSHEIDCGLCWEISNIGDDSLKLRDEEKPKCGWEEAHKICDKCPEYSKWGE